jgi:DNA polymerase-3 subunit delta'
MTQTQAFSQTWGIYGHEWAVQHLRESLLSGRARQSYLIVGADSLGKETLARAFAMALNCLLPDTNDRPCGECSACKRIISGNYADVVYSQIDNNLLKIEEIRRVAGQIALKPFEGRHRVAIFREFDAAQPRSQDALLKTLEEPAATAVLILISRSLDAILPTIASRSQILHLRPLSTRYVHEVLMNHGATASQAALLAALSGGRIGWALSALQDETLLEQRDGALDLLEQGLGQNRLGRFNIAEDLSKDKSALAPLLALWLSYWRDLVLICERSDISITNIDRSATLRKIAAAIQPQAAVKALRATQTMLNLLSTNANLRLALEVMFLDYPGLSDEST